MNFEITARIVVDTTTKQAAEMFCDDMFKTLPKWAEVVAREGSVRGAEMLPLTTQRDVDRGLAELVELARRLNRHAAEFEEGLVEKRVALSRMLHRDLHRVVDELDARDA